MIAIHTQGARRDSYPHTKGKSLNKRHAIVALSVLFSHLMQVGPCTSSCASDWARRTCYCCLWLQSEDLCEAWQVMQLGNVGHQMQCVDPTLHIVTAVCIQEGHISSCTSGLQDVHF